MHTHDSNRVTYKRLRKLKNEFSEQIAIRFLFSTYELIQFTPLNSDINNIDSVFEKFVYHKNQLEKKDGTSYVKRFENVEKRHPPYFHRVFVQNRDERTPVSKTDLREYPYYNTVRLSVGCTGTLITPSYVLTAAHCVHNGKKFKENIDQLKIEILHRINYRIHYVKEIAVPKTWLEASDDPPTFQSAYDYAVIRLQTAVTGRTSFTPLYVPQPIISDDIYFLGYSWYTYLQLWKSECSGWGSRIWYHGNILVSYCDSVIGNSGAAVFLEDRRTNNRKLIGVLSSTSKTVGNVINTHVTLTSLWTADKLNDICSIISPEGEEYGVCTPQLYNYDNSEFKQLPLYG